MTFTRAWSAIPALMGVVALGTLVAACDAPQKAPSDDTAGAQPAGIDPVLPADSEEGAPDTEEPTYRLEPLIPGGPFHGIHGLTFDNEGRLLAGSVVGQSIYTVDAETGDSAVLIGPRQGMADDIEQGPDGTLVWTAFSDGKVYARGADGTIRTIAEGLPGANSLAFAPDGRLFFTQVFLGDALYEADLTGATPPRKIIENMGGLNGFDFGPDGKLYGPLWFKGQIARVDVDTGDLEVVAEGFDVPAAVNFDSQGTLYAVDTARGMVVRVDTETGETTDVAQVKPAIDNLAFSADDRLFLTVMADNAIHEIDPETGESREVISSPLATAGDVALTTVDGREVLIVADTFALRGFDFETGDPMEFGRVFDPSALVDYPTGVGANGSTVAVASFASASLQDFDPSSEDLGPVRHGFGAIVDALPLGGDQGVLFTDFTGSLKRIRGSDPAQADVIADGLEGPVSIALADDMGNAVYVSEFIAGRIVRVDLATGETTEIVSGLEGPEGLDVSDDGRIIVAESTARRISAVNPDDGTLRILAEDLPIGLIAATNAPPSNLITGVAVRGNGSIIFSADLEAGVYQLIPE